MADRSDAERRRITYVAARIADLAARELLLLERAREVQDAQRARELEYEAGSAHHDSIALREEHELDR